MHNGLQVIVYTHHSSPHQVVRVAPQGGTNSIPTASQNAKTGDLIAYQKVA